MVATKQKNDGKLRVENFTENMEDYEYIEQKVEDELKENTGLLEPEIEEELNKQGVFDSEIEQYAEEYVDALNKAEPEDIEVQAEYYQIEDTEELDGVPAANANVSTKGYSKNMKENANPEILKNNDYYLDNEGIRCAVKLHKDTEKGITEIPYTRAKEYSNEGVGIILYLAKKKG